MYAAGSSKTEVAHRRTGAETQRKGTQRMGSTCALAVHIGAHSLREVAAGVCHTGMRFRKRLLFWNVGRRRAIRSVGQRRASEASGGDLHEATARGPCRPSDCSGTCSASSSTQQCRWPAWRQWAGASACPRAATGEGAAQALRNARGVRVCAHARQRPAASEAGDAP